MWRQRRTSTSRGRPASGPPLKRDVRLHSHSVLSSRIDFDPLFTELGRALNVFQAIEARMKFLLPYLAAPDTREPPPGEGWAGRYKYLESKEMLGNRVKFLQQRIRVNDPKRLEAEWRALVHGRNDVVHHFVQQSFACCESREELAEAIEFVRSRRIRALPLLQMLDQMLHGSVTALTLPPALALRRSLQRPAGHAGGAIRARSPYAPPATFPSRPSAAAACLTNSTRG